MPQTQGQKQSPQQPQEVTLDEWDERVRSHYGIPQKLWRAMAEQESGNNVNAVSPTGVRGRRQVTKATARQYGYNRDDPFEEAAASGKHLRALYDGLGHISSDDARWWGALARYYGGGNAIDRDGNLSEQSLDGISNPMEHVNRVARRIRDTEETPRSAIRNPQSVADPGRESRETRLGPLPKYDERGRRKISARDVGIQPVEWPEGKALNLSTGQFAEPSERSKLEIRPRPTIPPREAPTASLRSAVIESLIHQFEGRKEEAARLLASSDEQKRSSGRAALQSAQTLARDIARRGGQLIEVGGLDAWPYVKFRDPERQAQSAEFDYRRGGMFAADRARAERAALEIGPDVSERLRKMEEFERKPWSEQWERRIEDAIERGGREAARLGYRAVGSALGAVQTLQGGKPFEFVDVYPERFKRYDEPAEAALASRREAYRPSFAGDVVEGVAEGAPIAAGATILGGLTGGGLPATMAIGGGIGAAGADWNDPRRAAAQTALGAVAPVIGGKIGQSVAGRVAPRFTSPAAAATTRVAGEIGGGGAGNVLATGGEQLAFEGRLDPRELAKQAAVGAGLSTPGALRSLRPSTGTRSLSPTAAATRAETPILDSASRSPEARTGVASQIRAIGPVAEEAAIRAGLEAQEAASTPRPAPEPQRLPFDAEAARRIQHSQFGEVVEAADQSGAPKGKLRVVDAQGKEHLIKNPRTAGNREAAFITKGEESLEAAEGAQVAGEPVSPRWLNAQRRRGAELLGLDPDTIPMVEETSPQNAATVEAAPPSRKAASGQILGSGLGALQGLFERGGSGKPAKASEPEQMGMRGRVFETIGAAQTVSQLGSPGFVLRNVLQHASHGAQEMVTQGVAGLIDKGVSLVTGKRAVGGIRNPIEFGREVGRFMEDYATGVRQAREAIRRGEPLPGSRLKDMPDPETLTAVGRRLSRVLDWINEVPDAGNWNAHFQRSMRDQARVFARSKPSADKALQRVDQMVERAWSEADHASMRDKNFASKTLGKMKEMLNSLSEPITGTDKFGLGDFVVKYVQVPGALVKRGIEYSPLGVVEAGYYAVKGDQRRAVQSLARAVTGSTSGAGAGAALAAFGILVGPEHDEGQLGQLEREEGRRGYSINLSALKRLAGGGWSDPKESGKLQAGDQLVGIDWLQPWALQASAGAAIYNLYSKGRLGAESGSLAAGKAVYDSMAKALDVMGDQSVLKNLGRYWARAQGATGGEKFASFLRAVGVDVPSSFVPSLARQARQVVDPYERDTRAEEPGGVRGFVEEAKNRALAGLPGVSQTFPARPSVLTGQSKKTAIGGYSMPVRSLRMISPAPFTTYEPSDIAREAARLTDAGYKVAFTPPKREKGERTSILRRREERFAETFADGAAKLIGHPNYMFADDEMKAEAINDLAKRLRLQTRKALPPALLEDIIERAQTRVLNRESKRGR